MAVKSFTLAYNANGGSGGPSSQHWSGEANYHVFTIPSSAPSYTGRAFLGWAMSHSATSAEYHPGGSINVASGTTVLYAVWKLITYTVSYNKGSNGSGTNTTDTKTYGVPLTLKGAIFTRTGHTQTGWSITDGGSRAYSLNGSYTANAAVTLYPFWTPNAYTVSYKANADNVSGVPAAQTKSYGGTLTLSSAKPTRSSANAGSYTVTCYKNNGTTDSTTLSSALTNTYSFSHWNTNSSGTGTSYSPGGSYTANASAILYAQWGTSVAIAPVTLPSPTVDGYTLNGWYTAASGGTFVGAGGASYTPTGSVSLYAHWTATPASLSTVTGTVVCGNNVTATWASTGSTYKYKLTISCGNAEVKHSSLTSEGATTASVQVPTTWYSMPDGPMKNTDSATATCTLTTYKSDGTTQVGSTSSRTFTVKVPDSVTPTLGALTPTSSNNAPADAFGGSTFVSGYTKITLALGVTSFNGSALKNIRFYGQGLDKTVTTLSSVTSNETIAASGTYVYTADCTDTRGRKSTATVSVTFQAYSPPTITGIVVERCDLDGTSNNSSGLYFHAKPKYSITSIKDTAGTEKNSITSQTIASKLHTASSYGSAVNCTGGGNTFYPATPWSAVATSAYDVKVTVADAISTGTSASTLVATLPSVQGIWFGKGNDRLGLGSVPPGAGLYCDWNATFNGVLDVTPRRCEAALSGAGWYRVLHIDGYALGTTGIIIHLDITRNAITNASEVHHVDLLIRSSSYSFVNEISSSDGLYITKIRYIRKTNQDYGYVDIYYGSSTNNTVTVDFSVSSRNEVKSNIVAESLQSVAYSPSGETVLTEYTFDENTNTNPIIVQTKSASAVSVAANTNSNVSISIRLSGYTPIGIVGVYGSGSAGCAISDFYIQDQSTARVYFRNNNSNAVNVTWSVRVLYQKS